MIILVKYIALQWDNVQGGQGLTFENMLTIEINQFEQLHRVYEIAEAEVLKAVNLVQFDQADKFGYKILSVEIAKPISASLQESKNENT